MPASAATALPASAPELLAALRRLDGLLVAAVARTEARDGHAATDPFRGLHVELADVVHALARPPAEPLLVAADPAVPDGPSVPALAKRFGLDGFDMDVLLVAAAPELDLRYERVFAYLNDDVSRRRPTVALLLDLLCTDAGDHLDRRERFAADAPLLRHGLIEVLDEADHPNAPLLARSVRVDPQTLRVLRGSGELDDRLAAFCRRVVPACRLDELALLEPDRRALAQAATGRRNARLFLQGPPGAGRGRAAEAFAAAAGRLLLLVDTEAAMRLQDAWDPLLLRLGREAELDDAVLYLDGATDLIEGPADRRARTLRAAVHDARGPVLVSGSAAWPGPALGVHTIRFGMPEPTIRRAVWRAALQQWDAVARPAAIRAVADRFRLLPGQIEAAAGQAVAAAACEGVEPPALEHLFAAARAQTAFRFDGLADKLEPVHGWDDLVLPDETVAHLRELAQRIAHNHAVAPAWRPRGLGVTALFAGPPGTGKTLAAEIVAGELGLDIFSVDLSGVVSKWIGETEKNLGRIFRAAGTGNAILLFDEAEALFGKRSEVRDSHDRYANVEIAYLLQRLETYDGPCILTSNQAENLDEAFRRRIDFIVRFPLPEEAERARIWRRVWPRGTRFARDVDLPGLARRFPLSGAEIRNAALAAAFRAAAADRPISHDDLLHALRREHEKIGRTLP
jgi:hypothetical protein